MDSECVALHEFERFGSAFDPFFVGEDNREMTAMGEDLGKSAERPLVQPIDRLPSR